MYAPIVLGELLDALGDVVAGQVQVDLLDTASGTLTGPTMFSSNPADVPAAGSKAARTASFESMHVLQLPGRLATLRLRSSPAFDAAHQTNVPVMFFVSQLVGSALLAGLLHQLATGRRRAEVLAEHMTADLNRLALVARRTTNAVVITDTQRHITWVNEAFERITGYTAAEAMGRSPGALLQSEATDTATVQALRAALNAGEAHTCELLNRSKHGQHYWLSVEIQPLHDERGALTGFMAVEVDITAQKDAERELSRQRQSLANVIEGTSVGTWEWNVQTGETVFNERWAQMAGFTLDELQPTGIDTWSRLTHPDDVNRSAALLAQHFNGETAAYECEARMRHHDGHWVWVLDRGKLLSRSGDGRPRWMAGTRMDISERKHAEAALHASQALLDKTGRIGGIGGWELDVTTQTVALDRRNLPHPRPAGRPPPDAGRRPELLRSGGAPGDRGGGAALPGYRRRLRRRAAADHGKRPPHLRACRRAARARRRPRGPRRRRFPGRHRATRARGGPATQQRAAGQRAGEPALRAERVRPGTAAGVVQPRVRPPAGAARAVVHRRRGDVRGHRSFQRGARRVRPRRRRGPRAGQGRPGTPAGRGRTSSNARARTASVLEIRGAPMADGGFVTTYTDISASKHAEDEARRSSQLLRGAIDAIDEAFVLYDPEDRLVLCNQKYRETYAGIAELMVPGVRFEEFVRAGAQRGDYVAARGRIDEWVAERVASHRARRRRRAATAGRRPHAAHHRAQAGRRPHRRLPHRHHRARRRHRGGAAGLAGQEPVPGQR